MPGWQTQGRAPCKSPVYFVAATIAFIVGMRWHAFAGKPRAAQVRVASEENDFPCCHVSVAAGSKADG